MQHLSDVADNPELDQPPPPPEPDEPEDPNATRRLKAADIARMRAEREAQENRDPATLAMDAQQAINGGAASGTSKTRKEPTRAKGMVPLDDPSVIVTTKPSGQQKTQPRKVVSAEEEERRRKRAMFLIMGLLGVLLLGGLIAVWAIFLRKLAVEVV